MSAYRSVHSNEEESFSQSSDEKMDTGSESFRSQDTPNSILSSDSDEKSDSHVLRLQEPDKHVLRLSKPRIHAIKADLSDSFVKKMSNLNIESPITKSLGVSPPKFSTSLVLTTDHPLMSNPDFPDVIPKKEQDLSLSSVEDEKVEQNGYSMYSQNTNNSKNNLYFSENFVTTESNVLSDSKVDANVESYTPPDVARVKLQRRKIKPRFIESKNLDNSQKRTDNSPKRVLGRVVNDQRDENSILKYIEERNKKLSNHSTPKMQRNESEEDRINEWCESTQICTAPNFDLPIELSSDVIVHNDLESPDVVSSSTQEDKSAYEALVDPYSGRVALRPTTHASPLRSPTQRRKIQLPPEDDDRCSVDSISVSLESDDEEPQGPVLGDNVKEKPVVLPSDDISKSSNTCSEHSEPIPEYSAAEEFNNERSYISVRTGDTHSTCDMKVIEPYKRVLSHGGYDSTGAAVIVFSACHLPDTGRADYTYVMANLFLYVVWSLERLIGEEYVLVYLHGSAGARKLPSFRWLHECYRLIDRRLRKSLKHLYLVHPTFWLKSFVILTKPFVSSKFFRKLSYVSSLDELQKLVPVEPNAIPELVKQYDLKR